MTDRVPKCLLLLVALSGVSMGQGFMPPPDRVAYPAVSQASVFPLADNSTDQLARPFASAGPVDWKVARLMAEMSFLAYENSIPSVQNRLKLYDLALGKLATVDNHHFVTAWDKERDVLIIAFRGTDVSELADVYTDLDYDKVRTPIGEVHKGFWDAAAAVHRSVVASIQHRDRPRYVWLTGHSLGGAIATIEMRRLENEGYPITGLVTFGQPRVGDKRFTEQMNAAMGQRILRVINEDDIVVSLPPRGFLAGFVVPPYYSCGNAIQFLATTMDLNRTGGVQAVARPALDELFGGTSPSESELTLLPPVSPQGTMPPDPPPLTEEQFREFRRALDDAERGRQPEEQQYGGQLGGPMDWGRDMLRRAGHHPMNLYIRNIERFAAEGK